MIQKKIDEGLKIDIVFGPSYKASAIATAATLYLFRETGLDLGASYDRKEKKDHGDVGGFVGAKFFDGANIYVIDDVMTSGGTKEEIIKKIRAESKELNIETKIVGIGIAVNREEWADEQNKHIDACTAFEEKNGIHTDSIVGIRDSVDYLRQTKFQVVNGMKQLVTDEILKKFDAYMDIYGVKK